MILHEMFVCRQETLVQSTSSLSVEENEQLIGYVYVVDVDDTGVQPTLDYNMTDSAKF